nr:hypothetical protein GCM10010200_090370 [Actinomadura rugatobispora]
MEPSGCLDRPDHRVIHETRAALVVDEQDHGLALPLRPSDQTSRRPSKGRARYGRLHEVAMLRDRIVFHQGRAADPVTSAPAPRP